MRNPRFKYLMIGILSLPWLFMSCKDNMDDHYAIPDWLKGSAYEVLLSEGDYSIFLEGIDKAGYKPIVNGKSILTVMAPNDSAFTVYLNDKGYAGISDMPEVELKKLIGFHLMYYAFDWNKLVNFRPAEGDGATEEDKAQFAGYYFKHRTKSMDPVSREYNSILGDSVSVYHFERFLPVFSYQMFQTKGIDAASNYEYFFPNSTWTGGSTGFNVANASVLNTSNVITDNGYVYFIDQVLEPLETIYTELKNNYEEYSIFFDLYNSSSTYELDAEITRDFGDGEDLYLHSHSGLLNIAYEWPTSNYAAIVDLSSVCYNIFAPSNTALTNFFDSFWKAGGYNSLNDLDPLVLEYLIAQSYANDTRPVFPDDIRSGKVKTVLGTPVVLNPEDVSLRRFCVNGTLYGIGNMTAPAIFSSVAGPAFKYLDYRNYLYALDGSGLLLALASQESQFITLMPDTAQLATERIRLAELTTGNRLQIFSDDAGAYVDMSESEMSSIVNIHLASGVSELKTSGIQVLESNTAFNYWYVVDGKITTNALFNQYLTPEFTGDPFVAFTEIKNGASTWDNGRAYSYAFDGLFKSDAGDGLEYTLAIANDTRYPYYMFSQLLQKAGLVDGTELTHLMPDTRFIAFIPSNEAIKARLSEIPGADRLSVTAGGSLSGTLSSTNKTKLANWLRSYFITSDLNTFTQYPYPGSSVKGDYDTYGADNMHVVDTGSSLQVKFQASEAATVSVVSTFHFLPFAYKDGCFHVIEDILL